MSAEFVFVDILQTAIDSVKKTHVKNKKEDEVRGSYRYHSL